jgi:predicted DCC family thiol-disulfide oxidoreductase YuxK
MKVIFYDGMCPMCNGWVKRFIRWDKKKVFHFAPLEGEVARQMLEPIFPGYLKENTIIYFENAQVFVRSTAALKILGQLKFPYSLCKIALIIPRFIRDWVYHQIAIRRYRYGKRYDSCPIPPPEWKDRFLSTKEKIRKAE